MKNKYIKRSKISEVKFREIVRYFSLDIDAQTVAILTGLNRNSINRYFHLIRNRIAEFYEQRSPFTGEVEVDESYFGGKRIKGKRGHGAGNKTPVFGILQRGGKVYTEIVALLRNGSTKAFVVDRYGTSQVNLYNWLKKNKLNVTSQNIYE